MQKKNSLHMHFKAAKYEKQKPVSRNQCFKEGDDKSDKKTSQLGWCFESFTLHDLFVTANSREHVYFQQQIVALLLIHETHNLSSIKFTHVSQQTDGLCTCISWQETLLLKPHVFFITLYMETNKTERVCPVTVYSVVTPFTTKTTTKGMYF